MSTRYRVEWYPGTDRLHGVCHCGADHFADDPGRMWQWLLAHPVGHQLADLPLDDACADPDHRVSIDIE
ncbi:hypothetical protein OG225_07865 [Nocardia sp. NBC_01377]|uniref:hypothetical protein n=1 Tax=Nocardia sp. NBC_01377 TaxID=2903595 RepID=UPI0032539EC6